MSLRRTLPVVAVLLAGAVPAVAQARPSPPACSMALARQGEEALDGVGSWTAFHDYYGRFGGCRDGAIGEGTEDLTERLLLDQWDQLPVFARLAQSDPGFKRFVLGQFGEITSRSAAEQIRANAKVRCRPEAKALCVELLKALPR